MDGIVLEGISAVNESALTGESIPVDKKPGDPVSAATVNQSGFLKCEATPSRRGYDACHRSFRMVSDAAATKAPIAKIADKVSGVFVPAVIGIAVMTDRDLAALRADHRLCAGQRYFRAGHQLPVCTGTGDAGGDHGRQRDGCQERDHCSRQRSL